MTIKWTSILHSVDHSSAMIVRSLVVPVTPLSNMALTQPPCHFNCCVHDDSYRPTLDHFYYRSPPLPFNIFFYFTFSFPFYNCNCSYSFSAAGEKDLTVSQHLWHYRISFN